VTGINFEADGLNRRYRLWWGDKFGDALALKLVPIDVQNDFRRNWEKKVISSDNHGWNEFFEDMRDGLYEAVIADGKGRVMWKEEFWLGRPGKVSVYLEEWTWKDFYKIKIVSRLPLSERDYHLSTGQRPCIRGLKLLKAGGGKKEYTGEFLLRIPNKASFGVVLSEEAERRMGRPEIKWY